MLRARFDLGRWFEPRDIASLVAFRVSFGLVMFASLLRFWANGWIRSLYIAPSFHFKYYGFDWVTPWPGPGLYVHFAVLLVASLGIAFGLYYRLAAFVFFVGFSYLELLDKATYLNHYYLLSLLSLLLCVVPAHRAYSLDAHRRPELRSQTAPRWAIGVLRAQLAIVYFYAGLAKLNADWLLEAEPLATWLAARADLPLVGPILAERWLAYVMSWAGALFDLGIVFALSSERLRLGAYLLVLVFHAATGTLFRIGMFPWIMALSALIFFSPSWPRVVLQRLRGRAVAPSPAEPASPLEPRARLGVGQRALTACLVAYLALQALVPLRHWLYPGAPAWTDQGTRFAWRVMLAEKTGLVDFRVVSHDGTRVVNAANDGLTWLQRQQMAVNAEMVLEFARHLAAEHERRTGERPRVYADSFVVLNGKPSQRFIDANVDLAEERDGLRPKPWILPLDDSRSRLAQRL